MSVNTPLAFGQDPGFSDLISRVMAGQSNMPTDNTQLLQLILATMNELVSLMGSKGARVTPIPRTILDFTYDADGAQNQGSTVLQVIHPYNSMIVCSYGGITNCKLNYSALNQNASTISGPVPAFGIPSSNNPPYDFAFGASAFVTDASTANKGTQFSIYNGPEQIDFVTQPPGFVSFWVSPNNAQPPSLSTFSTQFIELTGWIMNLE